MIFTASALLGNKKKAKWTEFKQILLMAIILDLGTLIYVYLKQH